MRLSKVLTDNKTNTNIYLYTNIYFFIKKKNGTQQFTLINKENQTQKINIYYYYCLYNQSGVINNLTIS